MTTTAKKNPAKRSRKKAEPAAKAEIRVRLDARTKSRADKLFKRYGMSTSDGMRLLIASALHDDEIPRAPNAESLAAIEESLAGGGETVTMADLRKQWDEA